MKNRGGNDPFLERFDYRNLRWYAGVGGRRRRWSIGHGISNAETIKNMLLFTCEVVESRLHERIREAFQ